MTGPRAC